MSIPRWLQIVLMGLVVVGYPVMMHVLLTSGRWPALTTVMAVLPFALLPVSLWLSGHVLWAGSSAIALMLAVLGSWGQLQENPDLIYLLQNVGMQALLAWGFGHTLRPGSEPLISQLARRIHRDDYTPAIALYTRQATWAWTLYFVAMGIVSIALFTLAPLAVWSWFVNFLTFVLLGLMFAGEYAVRRWRLRGIRHISLLQSVKLYWQAPASADQESIRS